jgi:hypothetical protein
LFTVEAYADCYNDTYTFSIYHDYSVNEAWTQCVADLPVDLVAESAEITLRARVRDWGYYPKEQDLLCSNTNVFSLTEGFLCSLTDSTHPNDTNFFTIACSLKPHQIQWLLDDTCINLAMVTYGGTYNLDYSTVTVCGSVPPENPGIDIEKATNGSDADESPGPSIDEGDQVEWTYVVTNIGEVELSDITVTDDQGVEVDCPQSTLAPGSSMICSGSGTAVEGQYTNVGTATGVSPKGASVMDTDPSNYYGEAKSQGSFLPGIQLLFEDE